MKLLRSITEKVESGGTSKRRRERAFPESIWWVLCSYSSNRYPAETDQQEQEMRNINEEVEGQRVGRGERCWAGCFWVDFTTPPSLFLSPYLCFSLFPSPSLSLNHCFSITSSWFYPVPLFPAFHFVNFFAPACDLARLWLCRVVW